MSRLTGPEIRRQVEAGVIKIDPYQSEKVQAASIDLTLGREVCIYAGTAHAFGSGVESKSGHSNLILKPVHEMLQPENVLDTRKRNAVVPFVMAKDGVVTLNPGVLLLMHTAERLHTMNYEVDVTGKSSLGRLGIIVHHTAGHIDPGFDGQYTLEVAVVHPVKLYIGMDFCQARFHTLEGEIEDYRLRGNYVGKEALGARASRSWRQK